MKTKALWWCKEDVRYQIYKISPAIVLGCLIFLVMVCYVIVSYPSACGGEDAVVTDVPAEVPAEVPIEAPAEVSVDVSADAPVEVLSEVPVKDTFRYDEQGFPVVNSDDVLKIAVDTSCCMVYIYAEDEDGDFQQIFESSCIVGAPGSETPKGEFEILNLDPGGFQKGENWYRYSLVFYVPNGDYSRGYCFHTVAEDEVGNARNEVTEGHLSMGCVRLSHDVAKWMCENIPVGTSVIIV